MSAFRIARMGLLFLYAVSRVASMFQRLVAACIELMQRNS
jgi:hypothetical protein